MDTPTRIVLLAGFLYGFVSFGAAVAAEFHRGAALPRWARACVLPGRADTTLGRLARVFVFILMTPASGFLMVALLVDARRAGDVTALLLSILSLAPATWWVVFLARWLRKPEH